jgi:hypothetical protein
MSAVDDAIEQLISRPSLAERAECALREHERSVQVQKAQKRLDLEDELRSFMQHQLQMEDFEIVDLTFVAGTFDDHSEQVTVNVENFTLRARYKNEKVAEIKSSEFTNKQVYDDVLCVEVRPPRLSTWSVVSSLMDLGKILRQEPAGSKGYPR